MSKLDRRSPVMDRLREDITDLGQADGHVLIDGETGTGKTLVAHALHAVRPRASKKFVPISCAAYNDEVLAAKLPRSGRGWPSSGRGGAAARCALRISRRCPICYCAASDLYRRSGSPPETRIIAISNARGKAARPRGFCCVPTCSIAWALKITCRRCLRAARIS